MCIFDDGCFFVVFYFVVFFPQNNDSIVIVFSLGIQLVGEIAVVHAEVRWSVLWDINMAAETSGEVLDVNMEENTPSKDQTGQKMFTLKRWNAVAMWSWDVECDTCAICRECRPWVSLEFIKPLIIANEPAERRREAGEAAAL